MPRKNLWTREERNVTLALYFQLPFGRVNVTSFFVPLRRSFLLWKIFVGN